MKTKEIIPPEESLENTLMDVKEVYNVTQEIEIRVNCKKEKKELLRRMSKFPSQTILNFLGLEEQSNVVWFNLKHIFTNLWKT